MVESVTSISLLEQSIERLRSGNYMSSREEETETAIGHLCNLSQSEGAGYGVKIADALVETGMERNDAEKLCGDTLKKIFPNAKKVSSDPLSEWREAFESLDYSIKMNELDETVEINGRRISDGIRAKIMMQMRHKGYKNQSVVENAYTAIAHEDSYNPVKSYFDSLSWDGEDHLKSLSGYLPQIR